jgi:hypothetical protein
MNPNYTKRLSRDTNYKPTGKTYQSTLSKEDIAKKLDGYIRVESTKLFLVPLNTHLRYFTVNPKNNEKEFRLGGFITKFGDNNEYVVLSNGNFSWSVQIGNTIFYKKLKLEEYKEHIVSEVDDSIKKKIDILIKENKDLKSVIKEIRDTTIKNKEKKPSKKNSKKTNKIK